MPSVYTGKPEGAMISTHQQHDTNERIHVSKAQQRGKPQQKPRADFSVQVGAYVTAFGRHYPSHSVDVKTGKNREGQIVFHVAINGNKGDRPLTLQDLQEATAAFLH